MKKDQVQRSKKTDVESRVKELKELGFIPSGASGTVSACVKCRTCIGCQPFSDSGEETKRR